MLKRCIAAFFALLFALIRPVPQQRRCEPKVTGSFLQSWYCADWDDERVVMVAATAAGAALKEKAVFVPESMAGCVRLEPRDAAKLYELLYKLLASLN